MGGRMPTRIFARLPLHDKIYATVYFLAQFHCEAAPILFPHIHYALYNQYTATVLAIQASVSIGESGPLSWRCDLLTIDQIQTIYQRR